MGHRQKMTRKQRNAWDAMQYKARLHANRGHNYTYLTDDIYKDLERKGYKILRGIDIPETIHSESTAISYVREFRHKGYYARVFCIANRLRIKEYCVFYKKK